MLVIKYILNESIDIEVTSIYLNQNHTVLISQIYIKRLIYITDVIESLMPFC